MENRKVKIVEPDKGKHIAVSGDINTIVAAKEDTGGTYSFIEAKVFPGGGPIPHIRILSPPGMEQFFVETGLEVSDINVKPQPFTDEQKQ